LRGAFFVAPVRHLAESKAPYRIQLHGDPSISERNISRSDNYISICDGPELPHAQTLLNLQPGEQERPKFYPSVTRQITKINVYQSFIKLETSFLQFKTTHLKLFSPHLKLFLTNPRQ
jgi:hypothetical protein